MTLCGWGRKKQRYMARKNGMFTTGYERSEKATENYLRSRVEARGGICLKFASMTETGYPDRIVLMRGGICAFVELKSKGEHPTRLQQVRHEQLREIGYPVYVIDGRDGVDNMLDELREEHEIYGV